jgi:FkbM family methyltransferase
MNPVRFFEVAAGAGETVLDVGAFIGEYTGAFAQIVGPEGRVYAFECQPFHYAQLSRNVAQMGVKNVFTVCRAVSDRNGFITLNVDMTRTSQGSTIIPEVAVPERLGANFLTLTVETETVDHFCEQKQISPSFMKIDVEGAEGNVLRGAIRTIQQSLPGMYLETSVKANQVNIPSFPFMLEEMEYKLFLVDTLWHVDRWVPAEPAYQNEFLHPISAEDCLNLGSVILNVGAIHASKLQKDHPLISKKPAVEFFKAISARGAAKPEMSA